MVAMAKLIKYYWIIFLFLLKRFYFEIHLGFSFLWHFHLRLHLHEQMGCYKAPRCRVNVHACATRAQPRGPKLRTLCCGRGTCNFRGVVLV